MRGPGAAAFVNSLPDQRPRQARPGQAQYTLCCEDDGGVVDDLIAYLRGDDEVFLIPNAANTTEVLRRLAAAAPDGVEVDEPAHDVRGHRRPGPATRPSCSTRLGLPAAHDYMCFVAAEWAGRRVVVCRTGYTGELGFELLPRWDDATALWDALLDCGRRPRGAACGLGARDTLRTEMGYPLHGHDLSPQITPVQARVGWAVGWKKPAFWGREALLPRRRPTARAGCCGASSRSTAASRARTCRCSTPTATVLGEVTSGTFSPTLRRASGWPCSTVRCRRGRRAAGRRPRPHVGRAGGQAAVRQDLDPVAVSSPYAAVPSTAAASRCS